MKPPKIKAVFFDVDGTLMSFKTHQIPQSTQDALHLLREKGIRLYIATGRSSHSMQFMDQYFKFDAYVLLNGQYCYGPSGLIRKHTIDIQDIRRLKELIAKYQFPCLFCHERGNSLNQVDDRVLKFFHAINCPIPELKNVNLVAENDVLGFVSFLPEGDEKLLMNELNHIELTRFMPMCFDAMPAGGGKDAGIKAVLDYENIHPEEIMAFGDGHNDLSMLSYAGIGIAMGSAEQRVKDKADYVTASVDDDGIFQALKHFNVI